MTRAVWTHLVKDLRIEWRSKEAINSMLFFALLVVVLFSLAFRSARPFSQEIAGGVLCVATMFASVSALNQAWAREIRHQVMDAQRMAPTPGLGALPGQGAGQLPLRHHRADRAGARLPRHVQPARGGARRGCWPWCCRSEPGRWWPTAPFSPRLSIRSRNRELLLPLILFPIFMPALLAMVLATGSILTGESDPGLWIKLLLATTSSSPP